MKDLDLVERTFFTVIVIALTTAFLTLLVAMGANGDVDYCWIDAHSHDTPSIHYYLRAHRAWRDDAQMGVFGTFDDAVAAAGKAQCPLHK